MLPRQLETTHNFPNSPQNSKISNSTPGRKLRQLLWFITFVTILLFAGPFYLLGRTDAAVPLTDGEKNWLDQHSENLVLWFNTDFPPIEFISGKGKFTGMGADIIALVEKQLGVSFIKEASDDWNEHLAALGSGVCAVAPTIVDTAERQHFVQFTEPYASVPVVIITGNKSRDNMTIQDLAGLRVAVVSGYVSEDYLYKYPQLQIFVVPMPDVVHALRATSFGQVDAYMENLAVAAYYIEKEGISNLRVAGDTPYSFAWSIGISRHYPLLASAVQKALASIPAREMEAVRKRWVSLETPAGWSRETLYALAAFTGFVVLLVLCLGFISAVLRKQLMEKIAGLDEAHIKIRQSDERYREIVEGTDNLVTEVDNEGRFTFVNEAARKIFGIAPSECLGKSAFDFVYPDDRKRTLRHFKSWIREQKESVAFENRQMSIKGDVRDMLWTIKFSFDQRGEIAFIKSIARDITEQKKAYRKLRRSEATMASIFKAAPIGIGVVENRRLTYANDRLCNMTGYSKDEFLGVLSRFLYSSDEEFNRVGDILSGQIKQHGTGTVESLWRKKDGSDINVLINSTPINDQNIASGVTFTALDITQRKVAEAALKDSEEKYSSIFQESPIGIFHYTRDGIITECNKKFVEIIGSSRKELIALNMLTQLRDKKMIEAVAKSLKFGVSIFQGWYTSVTGNKTSYLQIQYKSIRDKQDQTIGGLGIVEDITEKKRAEKELRRYQEHLEELVEERTKALKKEKIRAETANRAKSDFLANMSHEIRTPLNAVTGFSELLSSLVADEKQKSYLKAIKTAGKNLMLLINDILDLSKIEAEKLEIHYSTVDLNALLRDIQHIFELEAIQKGIEFIVRISENLPPALLLDEIRLRQVLLNMVGNAVKFTEKGYIRLTVDSRPHETGLTVDIHIMIEDTGIGISEHDLKSIFDSFHQQTNPDEARFGGTGLGLTICKRLVEMMNGRIQVKSTAGRGSTFTITLKNVSVESRKTDILPDKCHYDDFYFKKGKILVVDDIESNRIFLRELLERVNLDVLEAHNGQEAVLIAPDFHPDAILMDIRMPVMDGVAALEHLKKNTTTRTIPVFAISASTSVYDQSRFLEKGFYGFVPKPVDVDRLLTELSGLLPVIQKDGSGKDSRSGAAAPLSVEARTRLPELIRTLESDFLEQWKMFTSRQPIQEVKIFAEKIIKLGDTYGISFLTDYGKRLSHYVNIFEVDSMKASLKGFPDLLSQLKSKMEEKNDK